MTKKNRRIAKARRALLTLSLVLVVAFAAVGGTIAWLTDKTEPVTNTFTPTNIDIELTETKDGNPDTTEKDFPMVPGVVIEKDPKVTVKAGSEAAWVFVKIEESANFDTYIENYEDEVVAAGWTKLEGVTDIVYYREVAASNTDQPFAVINSNTVTVKSDIDNAEMVAAATNKPTLKFTAYAIQKEKFDTAAAAWTEAQKAKTYTAQ